MHEEAQRLAEEYLTARTTEKRNALVECLMPMVKRYSRRMARRTRGALEEGDLWGACFEAIILCAERYESSKGRFTSFLAQRMWGAMLDYMRANSRVNRYWLGKVRLTLAPVTTRGETGKFALDQLPGMVVSDPVPDFVEQEAFERLVCQVTPYPRDREILRLYYGRGLNLREIVESVNVNPSRVCQLHKRTLVRAREMYHSRKTA